MDRHDVGSLGTVDEWIDGHARRISRMQDPWPPGGLLGAPRDLQKAMRASAYSRAS